MSSASLEVPLEETLSASIHPSEVVQNCPLCGQEHSELFEQFVGRIKSHPPLHYRICSHCGLVFQSPRPTEAELDEFYAAEYRRLYHGDENPVEDNLAEQRQRSAHLSGVVATRVPSVSSHLDIGCSAGVLLEAFRAQFHNAASCGIEPSDAHRAATEAKGFPAFASLTELNQARGRAAVPQAFELVSLAHVLEHLPNPIGYLKEVREKWLAPHGHLLIEVPNLFGHKSFELAHLFAFDPKTLRETLEQAGFEVVLMKLHSIPRGGKGLRYITMLAKPAKAAPRPVQPALWKLSNLRRRQGMSGHRWPQFLALEFARATGLKKRALV